MLALKKIYNFLLLKIYLWRLKLKNKNRNTKEIFSDYWKNNQWQNSESKSGDGSTLLYTEHIRREIPLLLSRLGARSLLDAPCGDFNWFKEVELPQEISYVGGDIVEEMIHEVSIKYGNEHRKFIVQDVISGDLPYVDIWMCRDLILPLSRSLFIASSGLPSSRSNNAASLAVRIGGAGRAGSPGMYTTGYVT